MPILIAILTAIGGAIFWWVRSNPRDALSIADDAVTIARNAPRKLAFRRQTKEHAVEGIDDSRLAVATLAQAFIQLDDLPTREDRARLNATLRRLYRLTDEEAEEMEVLGRWLIEQCGGASQAVARVGRRLHKIDGDKAWPELTEMFEAVTKDGLSERQQDAVADLRVALKRR